MPTSSGMRPRPHLVSPQPLRLPVSLSLPPLHFQIFLCLHSQTSPPQPMAPRPHSSSTLSVRPASPRLLPGHSSLSRQPQPHRDQPRFPSLRLPPPHRVTVL